MKNRELVERLVAAVAKGRKVDGEIVALIGQVDATQCYREEACSSTFAFCLQRLGMSEDVAYRRIQVARAARKFPQVMETLVSGSVHQTGMSILAPHLTDANVGELLARAAGKSKRDIECLVAELAPKPAVRATVRKVKAPVPVQVGFQTVTKQAKVKPVAPERYHVNFTASEALKRNLERAKELGGKGVEAIFEEAVAEYVANLEKKKFGTGRKAKKSQARGRYIAKAVLKEVAERDGYQCAYVSDAGQRCQERQWLEADHIVPFVEGGGATVENLRMLCRAHNQLHAEEFFGAEFMAKKRHGRKL